MPHEQILIDRERWYALTRDDEGLLYLEVALGSFAIQEVVLPLSSDETAEYEKRGKEYLDFLALRVLKWTERYSHRLKQGSHP